MTNIDTLTKKEVIEIHERLVLDAQASEDPISPSGIRSEDLLESAISRQLSGFNGKLKYDTPLSNAASLCYGICCNHSLHNGNKRTALVSLLCHLDKNGYTFTDRADQEQLYTFMVNVASHSLVTKKKGKKKRQFNFGQSDDEVNAMTDWIKKRTRRIEKGERTISYTEFEKILHEHNIYFENHKNNYVDVVKYSKVEKRKIWFGKKETLTKSEVVANIPYWPSRTVGKKLIKSVRKKAKLTHMDGIDSALFYGNAQTPDDFIQRYKKTLRRLAKT